MTYTVDRCADCPMFQSNAGFAWNREKDGKCRITTTPLWGAGNPPPTCPLRDSAVTIVIMEGR